jgi:hypothetical protein
MQALKQCYVDSESSCSSLQSGMACRMNVMTAAVAPMLQQLDYLSNAATQHQQQQQQQQRTRNSAHLCSSRSNQDN